MPKLINVIESQVTKGDGTTGKPYRTVLQYHTKKGELLAEDDSIDSLMVIRAIQYEEELMAERKKTKSLQKQLKETKENLASVEIATYRNIEDSPVYKQGMVEGWFNCESEIFMKHTDKAHGNGGSYVSAINGKGDVFVTINAAVKGAPAVAEGGRLTSYKNPKIAWDKFCEAFDEYMADKTGPIDWRRMPTICRNEGAEEEEDEYTVTARLFARKLGKDEKKDAKQP